MKQKRPKLIIRQWKDGEDMIAIFGDSGDTSRGPEVQYTCYMVIGQHSECKKMPIACRTTVPNKGLREYARLLEHLKMVGYNLDEYEITYSIRSLEYHHYEKE